MSSDGSDELKTVVSLLEQATSLRVVSEFLKKKDLPHSAGSWANLEKTRLAPAIEKAKVSTEELYAYLSEVEEYGACHCFLFQCSVADARALLSSDRVNEVAKAAGLAGVMKEPLLTTYPAKPTVSGIRLEEEHGGTLSAKIVETREYEQLVRERERGSRRIYIYERIRARAVNVIRLSSIGVLEVRVKSHSKSRVTGASYLDDIQRIWKGPLEKLFPKDNFKPLSLQALKDKLWQKREDLKDVMRHSDARMKDKNGYVVTASTPKIDSDLSSSEGSVKAIEEFLASGGYQVSENIHWKKQSSGIPADDIHVLLSGERNEFTITQSCTKSEYDYVLGQFTRIGF